MVRLSHAASAAILAVLPLAVAGSNSGASYPVIAPVSSAEQSLDERSVQGQQRDEFIAGANANDNGKDYARLRNLAIAGDQVAALQGLTNLLDHDLSVELRTRVYVTAISIATNLEDWPQAFALLNEAMQNLPADSAGISRLLAATSHLHTQVGDVERAIDLGKRAVHYAEAQNDMLQICHALAAPAFAYENSDEPLQALEWRQRQIQSCILAKEPLFAANGKLGLSNILASQGQYAQALQWGEEALVDYQAQGYEAGVHDSSKYIIKSLIALHQAPQRARALLEALSSHYRAHNIVQGIAEVEQLWATLAEMQGDTAASIAHLKEAAKYSRENERSMRARQLAYLQIQFDTQLKEQQISLLKTEKALVEATSMAAHRRQLLMGLGALGLLITAALLLLLLRRTVQDRQRYRWEAEHDGLTGLINQHQLQKVGATAYADAMQQATPFTVVALDIDLFKQINDDYGHAAGDAALQSLGIWIGSVIGTRGIAARRGGDEFSLLVNGDASEAEAMVQRLRERITSITTLDQSFSFTISAGICQAMPSTVSLEQLLHQADQALYRAKQQGRNRIAIWREEEVDDASSPGSLVVVGSGIQFARHVSERTLSEIRQAQVVFCLADPFALAMITRLRPDTINLGAHYALGKDRRETYREIDARIMKEVRSGKAVCAVFYGHPGVFADVPHRVIRKTRAEGLNARMEAGVSAEACLYADLGIDPGQRGVQSLEATHFLYFDRHLDPQGLVLLWQVALSGDLSCSRLHAESEGLQILVTKLLRWYPPDHKVILYEAAQLPIDSFRAESLCLSDLPSAHYTEVTTLVIPPLADELQRDPDFGASFD